MFLSLTGSLSSTIYNVPVSASVSFPSVSHLFSVMSHLLTVCLSPHLFPSVCHRPSTFSHLQHIIIRLSMSVYDLSAPSPIYNIPVPLCLCMCLTVCALSRPQRICVCLCMSVSDLSVPSPIYNIPVSLCLCLCLTCVRPLPSSAARRRRLLSRRSE